MATCPTPRPPDDYEQRLISQFTTKEIQEWISDNYHPENLRVYPTQDGIELRWDSRAGKTMTTQARSNEALEIVVASLLSQEHAD